MERESYRIPQEYILKTILAGNSEFSLQNENSKRHYTYKIKSVKKNNSKTSKRYFVNVAFGYMEFTYAGLLIIEGNKVSYSKGNSGNVSESAESIVGLFWLLNILLNGKNVPDAMGVYHFGKCGKCGRPLTDPESIKIGLGPYCVNH